MLVILKQTWYLILFEGFFIFLFFLFAEHYFQITDAELKPHNHLP